MEGLLVEHQAEVSKFRTLEEGLAPCLPQFSYP